MFKTVGALAAILVMQVALAEDPSTTAAKKVDAFKPPPGFQTRKRGDLVLYCKRESTVGTRFKTENCYNEEQMREYLLALEVQKRDVDRIRATCSGGTACAPFEPTR